MTCTGQRKKVTHTNSNSASLGSQWPIEIPILLDEAVLLAGWCLPAPWSGGERCDSVAEANCIKVIDSRMLALVSGCCVTLVTTYMEWGPGPTV